MPCARIKTCLPHTLDLLLRSPSNACPRVGAVPLGLLLCLCTQESAPPPPPPSHIHRFNMLRPVLEHMRTVQGGLGVVAVSPRYALR